MAHRSSFPETRARYTRGDTETRFARVYPLRIFGRGGKSSAAVN